MPITLEIASDKFEALLRHRKNVYENCERISVVCIKNNDLNFARKLMANAAIHDRSKFFGLEWKVLVLGESKDKLKEAVLKHAQRNKHHPEYWGSIHEMPLLYLAELASDWKARSTEAGTCLIDWINEVAVQRWGFKQDDEVYKHIMSFVDILLDKPLKPVVSEVLCDKDSQKNDSRRSAACSS